MDPRIMGAARRACAGLTVGFALALGTAGCRKPPTPTSQHAATLDRLAALAGDWEGTTGSGKTIRVHYDVIAERSVVAETYTTPSGRVSMSMYHADGPTVMVTHYCAQKNQPRLREESAGADSNTVRFSFLDATGMSSPADAHMTQLVMQFADPDHFTQTSTYQEKKERETTSIHFARKR